MGALGLGVGTFSAAMPGVILAVTPAGETSSAMSFNQVVRSVGFSIGSALSGFILSAYTPHGSAGGRAFPAAGGYGAAAWAGAAAMAVTLAVIAGLAVTGRPGTGRPEKIERKPDRPAGYAPGTGHS
jgi:MFS family permease